MLIPISWLKEYVDVELPVEELAELLTIAGLEVQGIDYIGIPGGNDPNRLIWDRELLVIGQILKVEQHPNADRLVLATVDYGREEDEVVVTGAPNLFGFVGQGDLSSRHILTPFAMEGATVYDGHKEGQVKMKLKGKALRGIYNRCMVCSAKELGLGEDHEGIMLFTAADLNLEALAPGTPLQDVFGDAVLDIEIIPNIARCASIIGVAREVAALTEQAVRYPSYEVHMDGPPVEGKVKITTDNPELNPRFTALVIEGVEHRPSPLWMQRRIEMAGQRPINVIVDISNYVMLEMGQPNHTFDYDYMRGRADRYDPDGPVHIITRLAHEGETLITLDGSEREMPDYTILVTDPQGNLSVGGIMGGQNSEINGSTTNVLLEAAAWNFINIRRSSHALKLNTEAGFRFSRGVHPSQAVLGARRAAELMRIYAGGTVNNGIIDYYPAPPDPAVIEIDLPYIHRWSGLDLSAEHCADLLRRLEFEVEVSGDHLVVSAPDHRLDIEGKHDVVEEICRVYGFDKLPSTDMSDVLPPQRGNEELDREEMVKDLLVRLGLQEVITYRLTTPERESKLITSGTPDDRPYITLANAISVDRVAMRHSLLASVAEVAADNSRHADRIALFETGLVYVLGEEGVLPDELPRLALLLNGQRNFEAWQDGNAPGSLDFYDLKGIIESLVEEFHISGFRVEVGEHPSFRPGRTARLWINETHLGWMGELHPLAVEALNFYTEDPVLAAEMDLGLLMRKMRPAIKFTPIMNYPAVNEDLAVIVDKSITAAAVKETIEKAGGFLLQKVTLFDVYEGDPIAAHQRSLAYHLSFQSPSKTLKDRDVAKLRQKIIGQLERRLGAKLRG
ncbi:MAG: phenylalanine--tRNA ligase subunit beta [Ardenticatenaceae bacterium]|nr:phenylalanine--tRNA ligase subunit beta [Ardenticatenaceae bacterium]